MVVFDFSIRVAVTSQGSLGFEDLAPFVDDLNELWETVDVRRSAFMPSAAGPEMALIDIVISATGALTAAAAWELFFARVASAAGQRIHSKLVALIKRARTKTDASHPPLSFTTGSVRCFVVGDISVEEIPLMLTRASGLPLLVSAAEFARQPNPGGIPLTYHWDSKTRLWLPIGDHGTFPDKTERADG